MGHKPARVISMPYARELLAGTDFGLSRATQRTA